MALTPEQRTLRARAAAHTQWAKTEDRTARSAPGRAAFMAKFEAQARELHPDGSPGLIAAAAESLRKAHFARLALASSKANTRKAGGDGRTA